MILYIHKVIDNTSQYFESAIYGNTPILSLTKIDDFGLHDFGFAFEITVWTVIFFLCKKLFLI